MRAVAWSLVGKHIVQRGMNTSLVDIRHENANVAKVVG